jgi:hypothetical protein
MKKTIVILAAIFATVTSCNSGSNQVPSTDSTNVTDSTIVDTTAVDSIKVDSVAVDTTAAKN